MSVWGLSVIRDEVDIIGHTLGRMRPEFDHVAVADHGSVDGTREILDDLADKVIDVGDDDYQAPALNRLVDIAIAGGAEWVVAFDADERWFSPWGRIADVLAATPEAIVMAPWYDHVPTTFDTDTGSPLNDMRWRRRLPNGMPKVACRTTRPVRFDEGYHQAFYPAQWAIGLEVRHFPYRSATQIERKARNGLQARNRTLDTVPHLVALDRKIKARGAERAFSAMRSEHPERDGFLIEDPCP